MEKVSISVVKECAKSDTLHLHVIAEKLGRHVDMVKLFLRDPFVGLWDIQYYDSYGFKEYYHKVTCETGQKSKDIFTAAGLPRVPKTTRNLLLGTMVPCYLS